MAYRCSSCLLNWPQHTDYKRCPGCGAKTGWSSAVAMLDAEARRLSFSFHYAEHEAERQRRGDPSPEALGILAARESIAQVHDLEAAVRA